MNPLPDLDLSSVPLHVPSTGPIKKLLKHLSGDDYLLEIDNTSLESFLACDRAAEYRLVHSRTTYKSPAIIYGSAVHKGLEALYLGRSLTDSIYEAQVELAKLPASPTEWRNPEALENTLRKYVQEYFPDPFALYQYNDTPCVELPFSVHLGEIDVKQMLAFPQNVLVAGHHDDVVSSEFYVNKLQIVWTGVIDLVVELNGQLWIVDHKTSSVTGPSYFEGFNLAQQFIGYTYAVARILNLPVAGALLNCITGRKPTKTGKSLEFDRRYYLYPEWQQDEWKSDVMTLVADFVERLQTGYFPKKTLWCVGKYGTCPYMPVCQQQPAHRMMMLQSSSYDNNTWNPLTKHES